VPLEDLLYSRAEEFVDDVERLARTDTKSLSTLRLVSGKHPVEAGSRDNRSGDSPRRALVSDCFLASRQALVLRN
jgi:hypothetical protein